jgi:hypothetical protein
VAIDPNQWVGASDWERYTPKEHTELLDLPERIKRYVVSHQIWLKQQAFRLGLIGYVLGFFVIYFQVMRQRFEQDPRMREVLREVLEV